MTQFQLISYIHKIKAESPYMMYKGKKVKSFYVPNTPEFIALKKARDDLFQLMGKKE